MILKNQKLALSCTRLGAELEGVCEHEGQAVFVPGALPGETVEAQAVKVQPRYAFAKLLHVKAPSPERAEPACPVYGTCGGCSGQHMQYAATLAAKRQQVLDCMRRIGGFALTEEDVPPVLGAENPLRSRNKMALPVGGTVQEPQLGFYRKRSHHIVPLTDCPVAMGDVRGVIAAVLQWMKEARVPPYDEETGGGLLRHVVVRMSRGGGLMVLLVATRAALPEVAQLIQLLKDDVQGFCALHVSVNAARGNVILGKTSEALYGEAALTETLLGLSFEISPLSFFQVNPAQTERLYRCAVELAELGKADVVVDAYAGAGTIALCMAQKAARVIGIEIVPQAVDAACTAAEKMGAQNARFMLSDAGEAARQLVQEGIAPDIITVDPPRKGCDAATLEAILTMKPGRLVMVSCNPATLARDLGTLAAGGYEICEVQPVDMFPRTHHVETVVYLKRS